MKKRITLTEGNIVKTLIQLSLPIMGTSFIQMAYNMTDMLWLGNYGSKAVAAVGTAGFFSWFGNSLVLISKTGAEVGVAQALGKNENSEAKKIINNSIKLNLIIAVLYGVILILLRKPLIDFFKLGDSDVIHMADIFLIISSLGMVFTFVNPILTGIFNASGESKIPFLINTVGLVYNMVLDPILIFGLGPVPEMGVTGAAISTVTAQMVVTLLFLYALKNRKDAFLKIKLFEKLDINSIKKILRLGLPVAMQNGLFSIFAMFIARIIAVYGSTAIAVQKVGAQIEAISWMTAGGLSTALSAFVGQNFGAKKWDRIFKGYFATMLLASAIGFFATLLLVFGGKAIFGVFIPEAEAISLGKMYLRILGYSQLFMCIEITTSGAFNGLGKTIYPSITGIVLTGARIPLAIILSAPNMLGLNGVWWSISISSILKGIILTGIFTAVVLVPKRKELRVLEKLKID
ncbi:MATE family efflux transporter [Clostridium folliculivorans]|uniref:Probable multidrug resistance protein NorM n=1 Tax=Clostridium folliculivorans TaxID=2886038 RepID=A0A9W5Y392_9CLOT|nr:MATE family efflux transporter [Clostridium folliculivorans]GKU25735.1 MATE family efflux transporter [Clostridium folliculivorans]GKU28757.1 MATE family efflux transporter [Clostridium folliculivorans]